MAIHIPYKNQMKIYFNLNIALEVTVAGDDNKIRWLSNQNKKEFLLIKSIQSCKSIHHLVIY